MLSLRGNIYTPELSANAEVLRQVIKDGNLPPKEKKKLAAAFNQMEERQEQQKKPAMDLRAMYGN